MKWFILQSLITIFCIVACTRIPNELGILSPEQVNAAKNRVDAILQRLPVVPGSSLIKSVENPFQGTMAECASISFHRLYGTNDLSFREVLEFYTTSLQSTGWHLNLALDNARSFDMGEGIGLAVSDQYVFSAVGQTAIHEGRAKFRTLYLLEVGTSIIFPPLERCRESESTGTK